VNRWSKQIDLDLRQVEKFLGEPVVGFIPSDYQTTVTSINLGQPLVHSDSSSRIALEINRITRAIIGGPVRVSEAQPKRGRMWKSIWKRDTVPADRARTETNAGAGLVMARQFES